MNKKSTNQVHAVKASIKNVELTKLGTATRLEIYANEQKIGELMIGRGSLSGMAEADKKGSELIGRNLLK